VKKVTDNGTRITIYHYSIDGKLLAESDNNGVINSEYIYLFNQPLAKIENNNIYYYHNDHLGTPMLMTDGSGNIVWEGEFLPFGEEFSITGTITNNLRFPGQYYDSETGLHQNWHRDYKPEVGRYLEADPILQPMVNLSLTDSGCRTVINWIIPGRISNPYFYAVNNPCLL